MQGASGDVGKFVAWLTLAAIAPVVFLPSLWPRALARTALSTAGELSLFALGMIGLVAVAGAVFVAPDRNR